MAEQAIDLWDFGTYDDALAGLLRAHADVVRRRSAGERSEAAGHERRLRPSQPDTELDDPRREACRRLEELVANLLQDRTMRAFHYTRLADDEVEAVHRHGIRLSTAEALRDRLDARVAAGELTSGDGDAIFAHSPIHKQEVARSNMFWMISHPTALDDPAVSSFSRYWGGEVVHMPWEGSSLLEKLSVIGRPRIIEVAVPVRVTDHATTVARAVLDEFALLLGCGAREHTVSLCARKPLPPAAVRAVHTGSEASSAVSTIAARRLAPKPTTDGRNAPKMGPTTEQVGPNFVRARCEG